MARIGRSSRIDGGSAGGAITIQRQSASFGDVLFIDSSWSFASASQYASVPFVGRAAPSNLIGFVKKKIERKGHGFTASHWRSAIGRPIPCPTLAVTRRTMYLGFLFIYRLVFFFLASNDTPLPLSKFFFEQLLFLEFFARLITVFETFFFKLYSPSSHSSD